MYYPQEPPKEPNGCIQTLIISRTIMGLLLVPVFLLVFSILALFVIYVAFAQHILLGFVVLALVIAGCYYAIQKWEEAHPHESRGREQ